MTTRMTDHPVHTHSRTDPCGCAHPEEEGCRLESQVRPRFFCGQLLTDHDLSGIIEWAAGKFRLQRYRDGWGVACGLDVRCDPDDPLRVIVGPGYAVTCCGDDIVVPHDHPVDLSGACPDRDPCEEPERAATRRREPGVAPQQQTWSGKQTSSEEEIRSQEQTRSEEEAWRREQARRQEDPRERLTDEIKDRIAQEYERETESPSARPTSIDLFITYEQHDAEPRATLSHSDCVQAPECEPSKTREAFRVSWQPAGHHDPAADWCAGYQRCTEVLRRFRDRFGSAEDVDVAEVRRWVLEWIDQHPLHHLCFLHDEICAVAEDDLLEELPRLLTLLLYDCRVAYTFSACHVCPPTGGVPLARVHLGPRAHGEGCSVLAIDPFPPHRRNLAPDGWPAPLGHVNIGRFIGARWEDACVELNAAGVRARPVRLARHRIEDHDRATAEDLLRMLDCGCDPVVRCGQPVAVLLIGLEGEQRVIGFCSEAVATPPKRDTPTGPSAEVVPGHDPERRYRYVLEQLMRIHGIGESSAHALVEAGYDTIAKVAAATPEQLARILPEPVRQRVDAIIRHAQELVEDGYG